MKRISLWRARWLSNGNAKWTHSKKQDRERSPHFVFAKELKLKKRLEKFQRAFYVKETIGWREADLSDYEHRRSICSNKESPPGTKVFLRDQDIWTITTRPSIGVILSGAD